jgi:hypothetical protein
MTVGSHMLGTAQLKSQPRTTMQDDGTCAEVGLDEVERIRIGAPAADES